MTDKELIEELQKQIERKGYELTAAKKSEKDEEKRKVEAINKGVGCLRAVKAMLTMNIGSVATHRQRDFYASAMVKYIDSVVAEMEGEKDPYPF